MKNQFTAMCLTALLFTACTKVMERPQFGGTSTTVTSTKNAANVENLGHAISTTNVLWKMDPLNPNLKPLITFNQNSNSGFTAVMIDYGVMNSANPANAFRFVAVNLTGNSFRMISVKKQDGTTVTTTLGSATKYTFGMNKKLYVATSNAFGGGGHIIEYDPYTQTAVDLGKPFQINGRSLNIFSLNVGKDGALYGGSYGDNGDVYTFRYNYDGNFELNTTSIDNESRYVGYVSGDSRYTYASVGESNWKLYAIDRVTGEKRIMVQSNNPDNRIEIFSHTDAVYAKLIATHYKLNALNFTAQPERPYSDRVYYTPYETNNTSVPTVRWNGFEKKIYYSFNGGVENTITINDITSDVATTGNMYQSNGNVVIAAAKSAVISNYNLNSKQSATLGNPGFNVYGVTATSNGMIYMAGYPKGKLLEYNPNLPWTLNADGTSSVSNASTTENPRLVANLQNADAAGVYGPMTVNALNVTTDGYIVAVGDNDRITGSTSRELAISTYKNGTYRNFYASEFAGFEFAGMSLSNDGRYVYIAANAKVGDKGKIYKYNPVSNTIEASFVFHLGKNPGNIVAYDNNRIIGTVDDVVYMFNMSTGVVEWSEALGNGRRIYSLTIAPDKSAWITALHNGALSFAVTKYNFDLSASSAKATSSFISSFNDTDFDESTKPNTMLFVPSNVAGKYDLMISGLKSLYSVKAVL